MRKLAVPQAGRLILMTTIFLAVCQIVLAESTGSLYRQAIAAFDAHNWTTAVEQFKLVYQRDPTSSEAEDSLFFWGESLLQSSQFDQAQERFDDYLRQWPEGRRARAAQFRAAEALLLARHYAEAKYRIERFTALYPADPLLEYTTSYLAEIAIAENDLAEAERLFREVIQKYPQGTLLAESQLGLARVLACRRQIDAALASLEPIIDKPDPSNRTYREAIVLRVSLLAKRNKEGSSVGPATYVGPSKRPATDGRPNLLQPDACVKQFKKPIKEKETDSIDKESGARRAANVIVEDQQPKSTAEVMWRKAQFFEQSGKLDPALAAYADLYRQLPHTTEADAARLAAARIYTQLHQYREAQGLYDELLIRCGKESSELDRATILFEAASVYRQTEEKAPKDRSRATILFKQLIGELPESPLSAKAAYFLARDAVDAEGFDTARQYLEKSLASDDPITVSRSLQLTWRIAAAEQDWVLVRQAAERLLSLDKKTVPVGLDPLARFWIAEADYRTGQYKSAWHRFEALSKGTTEQDFPNAGLAALRSAQSLAQQGDFSAARRSAEKASAKFPDFADAYEFDYLIGQCAFVQGEYAEARLAFERVVQSPAARRAGTSLLAQEAIASTFFVQEDYESAAAEFAKLQSEGVPSSYRAKALHYSALCYEHLGRKEHAESLYQRLVDRYPEYPLR